MTLVEYVKTQSRDAAIWYGGLGLLAARAARNLALPPAYLWLVAREIDVIGVRSLVVALTAALFTGMVLLAGRGIPLRRVFAELDRRHAERRSAG